METDHCIQEMMHNSDSIISCFSLYALPALIGIALLIAASLVSGCKVAFISLNTQRLRSIRKKLTLRAATHLSENPEETLAIISVLNCFNYVAISIIWLWVSGRLLPDLTVAWRLVIQAAILIPVILIFGEVMPKMAARRSGERLVRLMAVPLYATSRILKPVTFFLTRNNRSIELQVHKNQSISIDELSDAIEEPSSALINERDMLKGIIEFGNIEVSEIMCPRVDMFAIESKEPFERVLKKITESGYSRIPVYTDTFDQIIGILYIKDILPYINNKNGFNWQTLVRPPHFVPENKKINELLEELQMQKNHMAIVVDEYGGTSGLVTMEDIIEMIVGDIADEFDEEESDFTKIDNSTYIFKGKTLLADFYDTLHIDDSVFADIRGESESLAGLILEMKGELPRKNERFEYCNYEFVVEEVDRRRITSVRVHLKNEATAETAD